MNDYIKIKKRDIIRIGIENPDGTKVLDKNGNEEYIEFDLEDINTAENYDKCAEMVRTATANLRDEFTLINKKADAKTKGLMTRNEKAKSQAIKKYYRELEEAMDLFLGEGGTNKIFGKVRYLSMFDDLTEMLEPVLPLIKMNYKKIEDKIKEKYSSLEDNVLTNE